MAHLLVSVRSAEEALLALEGGADLIDVKEPSRGSLGAADALTVNAVLRQIAGRRPVSAAAGELLGAGALLPLSALLDLQALSYLKWGLSGCRTQDGWRKLLLTHQELLLRHAPRCRLVAVAYADWQRAAAPPPEEVAAFACARQTGAFLIDTWRKDGTTLLKWLNVEEIASLRQRCQDARVPIALAGSLGLDEIKQLLGVAPEWFAVRGAVCHHGQREGGIDGMAVRRFVEFLKQSPFPFPKINCLDDQPFADRPGKS
jgi:uncharacterized protein (UPF0264 family)